MLKPMRDPEAGAIGDWAKLNEANNCCPGCGEKIQQTDENIEHSRTKRGTSVFWHTECTGKVWH